jgi:hypothetical protein
VTFLNAGAADAFFAASTAWHHGRSMRKMSIGDYVFIADVHEAGAFAGREGVIFGHTQPSSSKAEPIVGARKGRDADFAWSVFFPGTREQEWFAPHLVNFLAADDGQDL